MFALANSLVAHATRLIQATQDEPALWTISVHGRVVGTLVCQSGNWRLSLFDGATARLSIDAQMLDGDIDRLAQALSARFGVPVQLEQLPV